MVSYFDNDYNLISNSLLGMLYFKKIKHIGVGVAYKNRFLIYKRSSRLQFISLFMNKGLRLRTLKLVNKVYLNFLYNHHTLVTSNLYTNFFSKNSLDMGEFLNLYNSFSLFKDWSQALIWRVEENLPLIKVISKKIKKKKSKKKKNKKKFTLEYKYIKKKSRFQIAMRWISLLIKTSSNKLLVGFLKVFIPFIVNPKQSKYIILKKKIYMNLLLLS